VEAKLLKERRGRTINIAILLVVHRRVKSLTVRLALKGGLKFPIHVLSNNN